MAKLDISKIANNLPTSSNPSIGGGTTTLINKTLFRTDRKVPDSIPNDNPNIARMVRLDAEIATAKNIASESSWIKGVVDHTKANIEGLGKFRTTQPLKSTMEDKFSPLNAEASQRLNQREELREKVHKLVIAEHRQFTSVINVLASTKTAAEVKHLLDPIEKDKKELVSDLMRLNVNEDSLLKRLSALEKETGNALAVTGYTPPVSTEAETPKPT